MNMFTIEKDGDNLYRIKDQYDNIISTHPTYSDANVEVYRLLSYTTWIF